MDDYKIRIGNEEDFFVFYIYGVNEANFLDNKVMREINFETLQFNQINCYRCGDYLNLLYCAIIHKLTKQNLLPEGFKPTCCECY